MVTKEQAMTANLFHFTGDGDCKQTIGPRGGIRTHITVVRRSGKTQTWERSPERFRVPVKYGMYQSLDINEHTAQYFHTAEECPLLKGASCQS